MNMHNRLLMLVPIAILIVGVFTSGGAAAQTGPVVDWWVLASGSGNSGGGSVTLNDTLGQPFSGPAGGGDVTVDAGYGQQAFAPAAITDLRGSVVDGQLQLDWTGVTQDSRARLSRASRTISTGPRTIPTSRRTRRTRPGWLTRPLSTPTCSGTRRTALSMSCVRSVMGCSRRRLIASEPLRIG